MAWMMAFWRGINVCLAAPNPAPPQPIRPTLMVSPGEAAEDLLPRISGAASALPMAVVEVFKNARREVGRRINCLIVLRNTAFVCKGGTPLSQAGADAVW